MSDFFRSLDRAVENERQAYQRFTEAAQRAVISQDDTTVTFRLNPAIQVAEVDPHTDWGLDPDWYDRIDPMGAE